MEELREQGRGGKELRWQRERGAQEEVKDKAESGKEVSIPPRVERGSSVATLLITGEVRREEWKWQG